MWSLLCFIRNECSAEYLWLWAPRVSRALNLLYIFISSLPKSLSIFPKGNRVCKRRAYPVSPWHGIKTPWDACPETRMSRHVLKSICLQSTYNRSSSKTSMQNKKALKYLTLLKIQITLTRLWSIFTYRNWDVKFNLKWGYKAFWNRDSPEMPFYKGTLCQYTSS